jgi:AraC-like DNA-binding protein
MIPKPFSAVSFEWLSEAGVAIPGSRDSDFRNAGWMAYPMPSEQGKGGYEVLDLTLGMTFVQTTVEFHAGVLGRQLPLMDVAAQYLEPTFQAMVFRGLRGAVHESYPPAKLAISPGIDLFRYTTHYQSAFFADASFSGDACHVSVGRSMLDQLIGQVTAEALLQGLGIQGIPSVTARAVPLHVSRLLFSAATPTLAGAARKLFCQAKVLEYLAAMVQVVCAQKDAAPEHNLRSQHRANAIYARLSASEGKLPTLDELALEYGSSAKVLNEEFAKEFGKSIYVFMTEHRLQQAHAALQHTHTSIKQLAAALGYSHVNNFTNAFKKKFGYPPGSLRRK